MTKTARLPIADGKRCPKCGHDRVWNKSNAKGIFRYECTKCKHRFT